MGAYGSPDTYPYDKAEQKQNKKYYISKYSIVLFVLSILIFIIFYIAGGTSIINLSTSLFITSAFSFVGNLIAILISKLKKIQNKIYKLFLLMSVILCFISFMIFTIFSN